MLSGLFHPQMSCCKALFFFFIAFIERKRKKKKKKKPDKKPHHKETHLRIKFYRQKSVQDAHFSLSLARLKINEETRPNDTL